MNWLERLDLWFDGIPDLFRRFRERFYELLVAVFCVCSVLAIFVIIVGICKSFYWIFSEAGL